MKTLFSKLKAAIVSPLIAPPVPKSPAEKPDKIPPVMAFLLFGFMIRFFFIKNSRLNPTKKTPRIISKY